MGRRKRFLIFLPGYILYETIKTGVPMFLPPAPGQPSSNENKMAVWCVLMADELDYINGGTQDSIGSVAR